MELRTCDTTHYIQTMKGGLVLKVCNTTSNGRPFLRYKNLNDIYGSEDAKRLQNPHHQLVLHESPCFLVADRTLWEIEPEIGECSPHADDDFGSGSDDSTTLKQLRKRLLTKKRKRIPIDKDSQKDDENEKAAQDDSDLNEPLINWKCKHSMTSKAKRKHLKVCGISSSTIDIAIKSEENLVSECFPQVSGELALVSHVKVEEPDAEPLGCLDKTFSGDVSSIGHNEVSNLGQKRVSNEYNTEPPLCVNMSETCATNQINYDVLEDDVPMSILFIKDGTSKTPESACIESLDLPSVEVEKQGEIQDSHRCRETLSEEPNADLGNPSKSSSSAEDKPEERCISVTQVPGMAIDGAVRFHQECNSEDKNEADSTDEPNDSQSSLDNTCGPNLVSITPSKTIADEEQPSTCPIARNDLNCLGHIEDELVKAVDKQSSTLTISEASLESMPCGSAETILSLKTHQPSERLLSSRKAFSPSSQEQLRLVMNSDEVCNESNRNIVLECKEKLFENQSEKNDSSPRSNTQNDEVMVNNRHPGEVSQRKIPTGPRRIIRKSLVAKGNLEGPRYSRTLPSVSTSVSSVQGCSEGAIAFSQRQMQDMETLAEKLMKELKSMKEVVEQKLLFEAYRNSSLKNDADEVKLIITNATKVEDMGKRWMSMIARDCTRFCKIMKMTPESTPAPDDSLPREKRKIRFADEAGGQLCHIKYFDDGVDAPEAESDVAKQV
ncbi:hypothetical protein ACS0TY_013496 [Phlomoides rotata]